MISLAALAAVPAALAAGPLFAQESGANANATAGGAMPMGEAEMKHMQDTMRVGGLALLSSRVAQQQASDPLVQAFAKWEVAEQQAIGDVLKSIGQMGQGGQAMQVSGQLQPPSDDEIMAMLGDQEKQMLQQMQGLSGAEFDQAYMQAQLEGHQQLLQIQENYLQSGQNIHHVHVAKLARPTIVEHIEHLQGMTQTTSSTQQ
jgi:putative membrane protein